MMNYSMIKHTISLAKLQKIVGEEAKLIENFKEGKIEVNEFVDNYEKLDNIIGKNALWFSDNHGFYNFVRIEFGIDAARKNTEHERQHMEVDKRYGLDSQMGIIMNYSADRKKPRRVDELDDLLGTPMVVLKPESYEKMKTWNKEKILQYLLEAYSADTPSPMDKVVIDILKK